MWWWDGQLPRSELDGESSSFLPRYLSYIKSIPGGYAGSHRGLRVDNSFSKKSSEPGRGAWQAGEGYSYFLDCIDPTVVYLVGTFAPQCKPPLSHLPRHRFCSHTSCLIAATAAVSAEH